jgi:hypothetical protein
MAVGRVRCLGGGDETRKTVRAPGREVRPQRLHDEGVKRISWLSEAESGCVPPLPQYRRAASIGDGRDEADGG